MGWTYKDEAEAIEMLKELQKNRNTFSDELKEIIVDAHTHIDKDEEIDTTDIWYKVISVDTDSFEAFEKLEELVNEFISKTSDTFLPLGPPQFMDGYLVQTLVDMDNLDNK